ncbi:MAG: CoA pyrophosphatase [Gammaproteobacteria bacterium]|nr:CoA pyrophosphatase [Gammaproteobacteria bacterium]MBI5619055.1 CoA pyrophosphatase [Gammaproteobacteria bacterium]
MRCDDLLKHHITARLTAFERQHAIAEGARAAAVAVTVTDEGHGAALPGMPQYARWQANAALVLTRRSMRLANHAGQWALPGGRIDPGETPEDTALRELEEEVGLSLGHDAILGRLDDFVTRSGFIMTPVVIWAGPHPEFHPNEHEVESVHRIAVTEFMREDAPLLDDGPEPGRPVLRMPVGSDWIAAPTAAILYQFSEVCLRGRRTRVAHFDQPAFAWR